MLTGGIDWGSVQLPTSYNQQQPAPSQPRQRPDGEDPETIRQVFLNDPHQMSLLKERNPRMAEVIQNPEEFKKVKQISLTMVSFNVRLLNPSLIIHNKCYGL